MTALQVAKTECANCDSAANCFGVGIADDLSCYMFRQPGKCYLAEQPVKRCAYFEQYVVPLVKKRAQVLVRSSNARRRPSLKGCERTKWLLCRFRALNMPSAKAATGSECA